MNIEQILHKSTNSMWDQIAGSLGSIVSSFLHGMQLGREVCDYRLLQVTVITIACRSTICFDAPFLKLRSNCFLWTGRSSFISTNRQSTTGAAAISNNVLSCFESNAVFLLMSFTIDHDLYIHCWIASNDNSSYNVKYISK